MNDRTYFAGIALKAILQNDKLIEKYMTDYDLNLVTNLNDVTDAAWDIARAMIDKKMERGLE